MLTIKKWMGVTKRERGQERTRAELLADNNRRQWQAKLRVRISGEWQADVASRNQRRTILDMSQRRRGGGVDRRKGTQEIRVWVR